MKTLFARDHARVLDAVTGPRSLLAFDFDGTLAPLFLRPGDARMTAPTARRFRRLCEHASCVVVSGRARADVASRLRGARVVEVIGNHGIEPGGDLAGLQRVNARAVASLQPRLGHLVGVELEDKHFSHSWHFRRAPAPAAARRRILRAVASLGHAVRVVPGKAVVNVVPDAAPDKGTALRALAHALGSAQVLFVGDDVTDEDVFRRGDIPGLVGVRVGRRRSSAAAFALRSQAEIDVLLDALLARVVTARRARRS